MQEISNSDFIRCLFGTGSEGTSENDLFVADVHYAITRDLITRYSDFFNYITQDEQHRAERFLFAEDRETYISCHELLRSVLSKILNKGPLEIQIITGPNSKPALSDNSLYFNITHTRDAFAIVVSNKKHVGIDLEKMSIIPDFSSLVKSNFSRGENKYIFESEPDAIKRFFLLWTRKEAFLKALGTGIIDDLTQIEVFKNDNFIEKTVFDNLDHNSSNNEFFIYSTEVLDNCLSIALPQKSDIFLKRITEENLASYLV
jgi:phosphopantetheine--protein transferase-like protein